MTQSILSDLWKCRVNSAALKMGLFLRNAMSKKRTIDGLPIYWIDESWIAHSREGVEAAPGGFLIWTDCGRDVPANAAHTAEPGESVSRAKCRMASI